jgi:hypothetical protein
MPIENPKKLAEYLTKALAFCDIRDKRRRLVTYINAAKSRVVGSEFTWQGGRAREWRNTATAYSVMLTAEGRIAAPTMEHTIEEARQRHGRGWAHALFYALDVFAATGAVDESDRLAYSQLRDWSRRARLRRQNGKRPPTFGVRKAAYSQTTTPPIDRPPHPGGRVRLHPRTTLDARRLDERDGPCAAISRQ